MKTSKTKALNRYLFGITLLFGAGVHAEVVNRFDCLKSMIPLTRAGARESVRGGIEPPFMINDNYLAFAETKGGHVTGFYVYDREHAWYYDTVELPGRTAPPGTVARTVARTPLNELKPNRNLGIIELTAQPNGLETIAIAHVPGFDPLMAMAKAAYHSTAILGASVLPVVGAFIPHPKTHTLSYYDPTKVKERELVAWFDAQERGAAAPSAIGRTIVHLATDKHKEERDLWGPMDQELERRREWIQKNNIDLHTFRQINKVMQTTCRPKSS